MRVFARDELTWGKDLTLKLGRRQLVQVVPDSVYPNMWRVKPENGHLTDMVNLTRAKDAAMVIALGSLNRQETSVHKPPIA